MYSSAVEISSQGTSTTLSTMRSTASAVNASPRPRVKVFQMSLFKSWEGMCNISRLIWRAILWFSIWPIELVHYSPFRSFVPRLVNLRDLCPQDWFHPPARVVIGSQEGQPLHSTPSHHPIGVCEGGRKDFTYPSAESISADLVILRAIWSWRRPKK